MAVDFEHQQSAEQSAHQWTQQRKNEAIDRAKKRKDNRRLLCILIFAFVAGQIQ